MRSSSWIETAREKREKQDEKKRRGARLVLTNDFLEASKTSSTFQTTGRSSGTNKLPAADASADVAVFRFTLGVPGLDDAQVPRIIGALALLGLAANRVFGEGSFAAPVPPSQARAEAVAAVLALACAALPAVESFIADAEPGRGREAAASLPGSVQAFRVAAAPASSKRSSQGGGGGGEKGEGEESGSSLSPPSSSSPSLRDDEAAAELAWSSYALLRNANCCTVVVLALERGGERARARALAVRGALPPAVARDGDPLSAAAAAFSSSPLSPASSPSASASSSSLFAAVERGEALYVSDASSLSSGGGGGGPWGVLPPGAGCALAQPIFAPLKDGYGDGDGGDSGPKYVVVGLLLLAGDRPRALSVRDRAWARAVARKLSRVVVAGGGGGRGRGGSE